MTRLTSNRIGLKFSWQSDMEISICLTMNVVSSASAERPMSIPSVEPTGIYQLRATERLGYGPVTSTSVHLPLPNFQNEYYYKGQHSIISLTFCFPQAADFWAAFIRYRTDRLLVKPTSI